MQLVIGGIEGQQLLPLALELGLQRLNVGLCGNCEQNLGGTFRAVRQTKVALGAARTALTPSSGSAWSALLGCVVLRVGDEKNNSTR